MRYRYDELRRRRLKTIEIIIEETTWRAKSKNPDPDETVYLRIGYRERSLQRQIRQAGGRWLPDRRLWVIARDRAIALGLANRIVR